MRSPARLKLAEALRSGLDEFAVRWVKHLSDNEFAPVSDEPVEEAVNRARLGFEVLANLLENAARYSPRGSKIRLKLHRDLRSCRLDVIAIALNDVRPKYVVTTKGYAYARMGELQAQFKADTIVAVTKALKIVEAHPLH